jgi:hypothetical protein
MDYDWLLPVRQCRPFQDGGIDMLDLVAVVQKQLLCPNRGRFLLEQDDAVGHMTASNLSLGFVDDRWSQ